MAYAETRSLNMLVVTQTEPNKLAHHPLHLIFSLALSCSLSLSAEMALCDIAHVKRKRIHRCPYTLPLCSCDHAQQVRMLAPLMQASVPAHTSAHAYAHVDMDMKPRHICSNAACYLPLPTTTCEYLILRTSTYYLQLLFIQQA